MPILEAHSCGLPVLVTDFSACTELTVNRQELVKVKDTLIMGRGIEQAIIDTDDLARKLNIFYRDWKKNSSKVAKEIGQKGREMAERFDWSNIEGSFINLIACVEPQLKKLDKEIKPIFYKI